MLLAPRITASPSARRAAGKARLWCMTAALLMFVGLLQAQTNASSELLDSAWQFETNGNYKDAADAYQRYLQSSPPKSAESRNTRLKLPALQQAIRYGISPAFELYLSALNARAAGDTAGALALLDRITRDYLHSNYLDDALYLKAYIEMMDNYDFQQAHNTLQKLRYSNPESRYYDTALYAEAIAQEQLGNHTLAINKLTELRTRHTGLSLAGWQLARDQLTSRMWFNRSSERLNFLQQHLQQASTLVSMLPHGQDGYHWRAVVSVASRQYTLLLNQSQVTSNTQIVSGEGTEIDVSPTNAFAGIVEGVPDSWVRITLAENNLRGTISVDGERHRLTPTQTGGTLSDINPLLQGDIDGNITEQPDHPLHPPKQQNEFDNYLRNIRAVDGIDFDTGTVGLTATIGVVIDSKFNNYFGGRGAEEAKSILNTTDGIFREQFGLALHIDKIVVIDEAFDPMNLGRVSMETMMRNFREYRRDSEDLGSDISMATLFSGNKNNDSPLGLAWIGSACRTDGFDVSVVTPYRYADLLSTHEIGHTLGAAHDEDTDCSHDSRYLMWPYLSSTTRREFSSCSIKAVQDMLATGNCFIDTIDISSDLKISDTYIEAGVTNNDFSRAVPASTVHITSNALKHIKAVPDNCTVGGNTLTCQTGLLAAGASKFFKFSLSAPMQDKDTVEVTSRAPAYMDSEPDNNSIRGDKFGNLQTIPNSTINSYPGAPASARPFANNQAGGAINLVDLLALLAALLLIKQQRLSCAYVTQLSGKVYKIYRVQIVARPR